MIRSEKVSELYQRLLGGNWPRLAAPVRWAHTTGGEKYGCFQIVHGTNWLARRMARWSRLPHIATAAATRLRIIADSKGERWQRQFAGQSFTTVQWAGKGGILVEQFGVWELNFILRVKDAALNYEQAKARLCLGSLRLPMPRVCSPQVTAKEAGDGATRVRVAVTVMLPVIGLLIGYDGYLDMEADK